MSNRKLKRRIFDQGVAAVKAAGIVGATYICPLCLKNLSYADLGDGELTLEHVPARSQGGKGIILTCRNCNSTTGHALEAESHRRSKQQAFTRAMLRRELGSGGSAYATFGDVRVNVDVVQEADTITLRVSKHNDPAAVAATMEFLKNGSIGENWKNLKFDVTSRDSYHPRRAHAADLKAAFLTMAAAFGYSYAMHDVVTPVREQIADPETKILPEWWGKVQAPAHSIGIIDAEGLAFVSFDKNAVVLPWPSRQDDNWKAFISGEPKKIEGRRWPWPEGFSAYLDHLDSS